MVVGIVSRIVMRHTRHFVEAILVSSRVAIGFSILVAHACRGRHFGLRLHLNERYIDLWNRIIADDAGGEEPVEYGTAVIQAGNGVLAKVLHEDTGRLRSTHQNGMT